MDRAAPRISRRNILLGVAGVAVAGVVATSRFIPGAEQGTRRLLASNGFTRRFLSLADAGQEEWAAQVGSVFVLEGGQRLRLAGIRPLASAGERPADVSRRRAFLAVFDVLGGATLPADIIHTARHRQYGSLPLFLSASGRPSRMFAVFN
jgi:hypothetical protein